MNDQNRIQPEDRDPDRIEALLCDRALGSLDPTDAAELESHVGHDDDSLDLTAAAVARGAVRRVPAPGKAQSLMLSCAERYIASGAGAAAMMITPESAAAASAGASTGTGWRVAAMTGWLTAAAMVMLVVYPQLSMQLGQSDPPTGSSAEAFTQFTAQARDLQMVNWTPVDRKVSCQGDICWSTDLQRGYIRVRGLPANNPRREQYQLWIFCKARPETTPVDGGVFDIPEGGGEVLIPVHAKLHVADVAAFAITREPPGGVVVSDRKNVVLLAKP